MKNILLLALILLVSCGKNSAGKPELIVSSIIAGEKVTKEDRVARHTVALLYEGGMSRKCSGTVISENLVITAAHCFAIWTQTSVWKQPTRTVAQGMSVWFPSYEKRLEGEGQKGTRIEIESVELFQHLKASEMWLYDIAVIKLASKIPNTFKPVSILDAKYEIATYTDILVAGFGYTTRRKNFLESMDLGNINKIKLPFLRKSAKNVISLKEDEGVYGTHNGDSGGPAYLEQDKELLLIGALIGGAMDRSAIYTDVRAYKDFILDFAKKTDATAPIFKMPE